MQVPSLPAGAGVAGSSYAAAKGGETDKQASESSNQQSTAKSPGGKSEAAGVEAGSQTEDRGGNGQEFYDQFDSSGQADSEQDPHGDEDGQDDDTHQIAPSGSDEDDASEPPHLDLIG